MNKCGFCNSSSGLVMEEQDIRQAYFRYMVIKCANCGAILSTETVAHTNLLIDRLTEKVEGIASHVSQLGSILNQIAAWINNRN